MLQSPFKFLDPYQKEDYNAFFGRDEEVKELYEMVTKNRLTLVYGDSGTGKTSLIQCGLASRFSASDWLPVFIRRDTDINISLRRELRKKLNNNSKVADDLDEKELIQTLFDQHLRPVYLIFDQFEELYILGNSDDHQEQQKFYDSIEDLLDANLPCRLLFVMREDYFGHLNGFEKNIPTLFSRKLRVEPMTRENLLKVIKGSCKVHNIQLNDSGPEPGLIVDNIMGKSGAHMPYVQVYLHMLYKEALGAVEENNGIAFTEKVIQQVGPISDVLGRFLKEQEVEIENRLSSHFAKIEERLVKRVLDIFVTDEGTRAPIKYRIENNIIQISGRQTYPLENIPEEQVSACLMELESSRILRQDEDEIELAHDTIAALIDQQRSADQRQLIEYRRRIEIAYGEYKQSLADGMPPYYLDKERYNRLAPYLSQLVLEPEWEQFLQDSKNKINKDDSREKNNAIEALKRERRVNMVLWSAIVLAFLGSIYGFIQRDRVLDERDTAKKALLKAEKLSDAFFFYKDRFALASDEDEDDGVTQYYFIDKNGNKLDTFGTWDALEQFDGRGFAKGTKQGGATYLIDTSGNQYRVSYDLTQMDYNVQALDLSGKGLKLFPYKIFQCDSLKVLILDNNQIKNIPSQIGQLRQLKIVYLANNQLTELPSELFNLPEIKELYVRENQISIVPASIAACTTLSKMNLSKNALTSLPEGIARLQNLKALDISENQFETVPKDITFLSGLQELYLNNNYIQNLNDALFNLNHLKVLCLQNNRITSIPVQIQRLTNLEHLDINHNIIRSLPEAIGNCRKLSKLDIGDDSIKTLPVNFWKLTNLKVLVLLNNQMTTIPADIKNLTRLRVLDLGANRISKLPDELFELDSLKTLIVENNKIENIPASIRNLKNLKRLIIGANSITDLPDEIIELEKLQHLDLNDNPVDDRVIDEFKAKMPGCNIEASSDIAAQAREFFKNKDYKNAFERQKLAIRRDSNNANIWYNMSYYALFVNDGQTAISAAQKTLDINPKLYSVITNLTLGYVLNNQYDKAEPIYKKWKKSRFPDNGNAPAKQLFLEDIRTLQEAGINHQDFTQVVNLLRK